MGHRTANTRFARAALVVIACGVSLSAGCSWLEPRVTSPVSGQQVTPEELQNEVRLAETQAQAESKRAEAAFRRRLSEIEFKAQSEADALIAEYDAMTMDREAATLNLRERAETAIREAQRRAEAMQSVWQGIATTAQASGLPGVAAAGSAMIALGGLLWGSRKSKQAADARGEAAQALVLAEKARYEEHMRAWDEAKKDSPQTDPVALVTSLVAAINANAK